jgi:hypothetical protein
MSDIKQAAIWMKLGLIVRCGEYLLIADENGTAIVFGSDFDECFAFTLDQLLSDDWEVCEY